MASEAASEAKKDWEPPEEQEVDTTGSGDDVDHFPSRWSYWLAAIGTSVGFGNVWRFPYMVFQYGGLAFFIPYLILLVVVVAPVTIFELGLGQLSQSGLITAFNSMHSRTRGTGFGFLLSWQVLTYYPLLLCWSLIYMVNSAKKDLPWVATDAQATACAGFSSNPVSCQINPMCVWIAATDKCDVDSTYAANKFFIAGCNIQVDHRLGVTSYSWQVLLSWMFTFGSAYAALAFGAKVLGYMTYVTMTMPAIFLVVLAIVGCVQDGAGDGIKAYIGKLDTSQLTGDVWSASLAQGIFSMGAVQGSMCGFAAHNRREQNFVQDALVVILGDTLFAFLAGLSVFAIAGSLAYANGVPLEDLPLMGTSLVFETYPLGLANVPQPGAQILSFLFFLTLFLLGFSTVAGCSEAVVMIVLDSRVVQASSWLKSNRRLKVLACIVGFWAACGFLYATDMGKHFLDTMDEFHAAFSALMFVYLFSLAAWMVGNETTRAKIGNLSHNFFLVGFHVTCWVGALTKGLLTRTAVKNGAMSNAAMWGCSAGITFLGLTVSFVAPLFLVADNSMPMSTRAYVLYLEGLERLRSNFNDTACKGRTFWRVPITWTVLMKYLIPIVSSFMYVSGALADNFQLGAGVIVLPDGTLETLPPYDWYVFFLCSVPTMLIPTLGILGWIFPQYMDFLLPPVEQRPLLLLDDLDARVTYKTEKTGSASDLEQAETQSESSSQE